MAKIDKGNAPVNPAPQFGGSKDPRLNVGPPEGHMTGLDGNPDPINAESGPAPAAPATRGRGGNQPNLSGGERTVGNTMPPYLTDSGTGGSKR